VASNDGFGPTADGFLSRPRIEGKKLDVAPPIREAPTQGGTDCPARAFLLLASGTDDVFLMVRLTFLFVVAIVIVDNIFFVAILFFLLSSYPGLASRHGVALAVLFGGPVIYLLVSWVLTRRLLMFHFWSAKAGALLLFALWPLLYLTGWEAFIQLTATVVGLSRLEQVIFILSGGVDQDAPQCSPRWSGPMSSVLPTPADVIERSGGSNRQGSSLATVSWGAPSAQERGPTQIRWSVDGRVAMAIIGAARWFEPAGISANSEVRSARRIWVSDYLITLRIRGSRRGIISLTFGDEFL
jgi:hypothetical protein